MRSILRPAAAHSLSGSIHHRPGKREEGTLSGVRGVPPHTRTMPDLSSEFSTTTTAFKPMHLTAKHKKTHGESTKRAHELSTIMNVRPQFPLPSSLIPQLLPAPPGVSSANVQPMRRSKPPHLTLHADAIPYPYYEKSNVLMMCVAVCLTCVGLG